MVFHSCNFFSSDFDFVPLFSTGFGPVWERSIGANSLLVTFFSFASFSTLFLLFIILQFWSQCGQWLPRAFYLETGGACLLQWYGHSHVLDMPHSQNPRDMGIPSRITLAIWVSGDAHAYHCDTPSPIPYFKGKALGQDWLTTYKLENFADSKDWLSISQVNVERNLADLILRHFFPLAFFLLDFYGKKINKLITIWWQRQTSRDRTFHENKKVKLFHGWIFI